jgi:hypothetical protein
MRRPEFMRARWSACRHRDRYRNRGWNVSVSRPQFDERRQGVEGEDEDGGRRSEVGGRRTEDGGRRSEVGGRRSEDGGRRTEDGGRRSEGRKGGRGSSPVNVHRRHKAAEGRRTPKPRGVREARGRSRQRLGVRCPCTAFCATTVTRHRRGIAERNKRKRKKERGSGGTWAGQHRGPSCAALNS